MPETAAVQDYLKAIYQLGGESLALGKAGIRRLFALQEAGRAGSGD